MIIDNSNFLYRFKTKEEFTKEYKDSWLNNCSWNSFGYMDYLFGRFIEYEKIDTNKKYFFKPDMEIRYEDDFKWYVDQTIIVKDIGRLRKIKINKIKNVIYKR